MISDFVNFVRSPDFYRDERKFYSKILRSLFALVILFGLQALLQIFFLTLSDPESNPIKDYNDHINKSYSLLYTLAIGPLLEEFTFRLFLTRFNVTYFKLSFSLFVGLVLSMYLVSIFELGVRAEIVSVGIGFICYFIMSIFNFQFKFLKEKWDKAFSLLLWLSIFLFGIVHVPQLIYHNFEIIYILKSVISVMLSAIVYTYVRVRYGIGFSFFMHLSFNSFALL